MRLRHPDLFSDTHFDDVPQLPKSVFEYHLESLTNRKQENQFEHFCRKLAEREICPNLRLQTGPTGGGDSKVDSETYPIVGMPSPQLAIVKRQLDIREAWQIGENDPDRAALLEDDDPIIPPGVSDPPVNKTLASIRTMREQEQ